ncbi:hypothetical protein HMPREF9089_00956 [Eubacterium brachy ATCC 33089]|nr:hypothetical protein HMPREF9089_00956 [Eubacterium brachy ATCC 33089]
MLPWTSCKEIQIEDEQMKIDLEKGIYIGIILMGVIVLVAYKVKRRKERNQDFPRLNEIDDDR